MIRLYQTLKETLLKKPTLHLIFLASSPQHLEICLGIWAIHFHRATQSSLCPFWICVLVFPCYHIPLSHPPSGNVKKKKKNYHVQNHNSTKI